jgi:alkylhydroperoxidase/carboxymuconolactone decarboxylase family protein YurZ
MPLDERLLRLIAIGASISANCQPCLEHNLGRARACGAPGDEIAQAIEVGRLVRQGAAARVDRLAAELSPTAASLPPAAPCSC